MALLQTVKQSVGQTLCSNGKQVRIAWSLLVLPLWSCQRWKFLHTNFLSCRKSNANPDVNAFGNTSSNSNSNNKKKDKNSSKNKKNKKHKKHKKHATQVQAQSRDRNPLAVTVDVIAGAVGSPCKIRCGYPTRRHQKGRMNGERKGYTVLYYTATATATITIAATTSISVTITTAVTTTITITMTMTIIITRLYHTVYCNTLYRTNWTRLDHTLI